MDIKQRTGIAAGEYKRRRRQLMDMAGEDAILVLPAASEKVRSLEIPSPRQLNSHVPKVLERAVLKALSRDKATRYQSALELHDDLQAVLHERARRGKAFGRRGRTVW
jgi:hypothetical protein